MALRELTLLSRLDELDEHLGSMRQNTGLSVLTSIDRFRLDASAARFHLKSPMHSPILLATIGGTGTGKSTLVNRLIGADLTATSFRRTFTAGAVAIAKSPDAIPLNWLGLNSVVPKAVELPVRGQADLLAVVPLESELTQHITLIDTPDLDGDQPAHHIQADRVFRWAQAILFLVTPEKYQMTELMPYYRMAGRYGVPALFVMNKAEEQIVVDDYARVVGQFGSERLRDSPVGKPSERESLVQELSLREPSPLSSPGLPGEGGHAHAGESGSSYPRIFAIARDGSGYEPPASINLASLRHALETLQLAPDETRRKGLSQRCADLMDRLRDQILQPLRKQRTEADQLIAGLRALEAPTTAVDVNPLTRQLQRRLQQRSVLYLMGPGRMLDRVRQVPMFLARLPRTTWDLLRHGNARGASDDALPKEWDRTAPNFHEALADQLAIVQSRIDDALRASKSAEVWIAEDQAGYSAAKFDPDAAGKIADEEIADLKNWLESRWNATPRDTAMLKKLLAVVPGGDKLTQWSEAAPYLLAIVVATHHVMFGHIDLMIIGGFSLATWLTERLSNEVASRTRLTNQRIGERFTKLAHEQIERMCAWIAVKAPASQALNSLEGKADRISESLSAT